MDAPTLILLALLAAGLIVNIAYPVLSRSRRRSR
jgi:hypothetical protein